jgi:hypothetical protein
MTYIIYSQQQLQLKSIARLKQIYSEIACTIEVSDKRCKDSWITAIADYQASKIQKLAPAAPDNQALAQAELDNYIADQAQVVAPKPLRIVEISFDHHEYYAGNQLIASISHDDSHLTQRWVVIVNDKELFRANTVMRCDRFIWVESMGDIIPRTSPLDPCVPVSVYTAPDVLSFRFCSCVCNRDNSRYVRRI